MTLTINKRQRGLLLKALLLVFALHTSIGYAACCITLAPADTVASMPCHDNNQDRTRDNSNDSNQNTHIDHNKCCSSCFAIGIPTNLTKPLSSSAENITADIFILFISSSIDPLFRPPIALLS